MKKDKLSPFSPLTYSLRDLWDARSTDEVQRRASELEQTLKDKGNKEDASETPDKGEQEK